MTPDKSTTIRTDAAIAAFTTAKRELLTAMRADRADGAYANEIARRLDGIWSRPIVLRILGEPDILDDALMALKNWKAEGPRDCDYDQPDVSLTRRNGEAYINIGTHLLDPGLRFEALQVALGVGADLRAAGLGLAIGDSSLNIEDRLARGEKVRIVRLSE